MPSVLRKRLLQFDLAAGLTAGFVLTIMAAAGACMVFRPQLELRACPEFFTVAPGTERLSLDTLATNAAAVYAP